MVPWPGTGVLGCPKVTYCEESGAKQGDQASQEPRGDGPKGGDQHLRSHTHHSCTSQSGILDLNLMEQDMAGGNGSMEDTDMGLGGVGFLGDQTGSPQPQESLTGAFTPGVFRLTSLVRRDMGSAGDMGLAQERTYHPQGVLLIEDRPEDEGGQGARCQ